MSSSISALSPVLLLASFLFFYVSSIPLPQSLPLDDIYVSKAAPFEFGELPVGHQQINGSFVSDKITFMEAFFPQIPGTYAVNVFLTAFDGDVMAFSYSEVLSNVSAHGFIMVALTTFPLYPQDVTADVVAAIAWLSENLAKYLPAGVVADWDNSMSLMGHSAGGKVVTEVVMQSCGQIKALVLIDPVDGNPMIIHSDPVNFTLPVFLLGTGLGNIAAQQGFPPCAPAKVDFQHFYQAMNSPKVMVNATDFGHLDMLNEEQATLWEHFCTSGLSRGADLSVFRHYVWGSVSAYLMAIFQGQVNPSYCDYMNEVMIPPLEISLVVEADFSAGACPKPGCSNF